MDDVMAAVDIDSDSDVEITEVKSATKQRLSRPRKCRERVSTGFTSQKLAMSVENKAKNATEPPTKRRPKKSLKGVSSESGLPESDVQLSGKMGNGTVIKPKLEGKSQPKIGTSHDVETESLPSPLPQKRKSMSKKLKSEPNYSESKPAPVSENGVSSRFSSNPIDGGYSLEDRHKVPADLAALSWPHRFVGDSKLSNESDVSFQYLAHYTQATVDNFSVMIGQCVYVNAEAGKEPWIGRVLELFKDASGLGFYRVQWFFRFYDTAMGDLEVDYLDKRRLWWSQVCNTNELNTILGIADVARVQCPPACQPLLPADIPKCEFYYLQGYAFANMSFFDIPEDAYAPFPDEEKLRFGELPHKYRSTEDKSMDAVGPSRDSLKSNNDESDEEEELVPTNDTEASAGDEVKPEDVSVEVKLPTQEQELSLLDLYAGCGAMSTGLEMGGPLAGATIVTKWAVDFNEAACRSLKFNHPATEVRNEPAESFLKACKAWKQICERFGSVEVKKSPTREAGDSDGEVVDGQKKRSKAKTGSSRSKKRVRKGSPDSESGIEKVEEDGEGSGAGEYEVEALLAVRWSPDPDKPGMQFRVRWKGYSEDDDTWEPEESLCGCEDIFRDFVRQGRERKILPLPGDVDVVCGGPPCQGASGHNRFRNYTDPLKCERNRQLVVFMDIVQFLCPRFVLMENVSDLMRFKGGLLARYSISRLVDMNYQNRTGLLVAGSFGVAQFRMRAFFFGARPGEILPQFPLPTHLCAFVKNNIPQLWTQSLVAWDEKTVGLKARLHSALVLKDCISDLPPVSNQTSSDETTYLRGAKTLFEKRVRLPKSAFIAGKDIGSRKKAPKAAGGQTVFDHRPLHLNDDDYYRTTCIPKKKGACFRDLEGVLALPDKTVYIDPKVQPRPTVPSGKPLCPDYAISFRFGKSFKPFGRLWWDETVPTVLTRAQPHNQRILHPSQDRVLTIRENARLQGFPDHYKLLGDVKERYCQVGNAVSVQTAQALGFALGRAAIGSAVANPPTFELPATFPFIAGA